MRAKLDGAHMPDRLRRACLVALLAASAGCELPFATACTDDFRPAIRLTIVDSISGDPLPEPLAWVRDGDYVDTLEVWQGEAWGAGERAGTYEVHVEHDGYATWLSTGVRVTEDECHVRTRELTARMQPNGES